MFLFVLIVFFSCARAEEEIRLTCRRQVQNLSWSFDPSCPERPPELVEIKTHSANYEEPGACNVNGEELPIIRSQVGCPAISVEEVSRPVQIVVKIKAACESYEFYGSSPEYATAEVFGFYGIRLDLQARNVAYREGGFDWQVSHNVTFDGSIYGDQVGEDDFHELIFDLRVGSTLLFYNGNMLKWARDMRETGKVELIGGSNFLLMNWVLIRDATCSMECDSRWDCNGHGVTTDVDSSDGCDCTCDFNWFGDQCTKQTFIPLSKDKTCDQPPSVRTSGATFLSCINFCASQNYTCNYFAFNELRATCETFTECFVEGIDVIGSTIYQKREMCRMPPEDTLGSMYIRMLDSSGFTPDGEYLLYIQYPTDGVTLDSLEFQRATEGCASLNHNIRNCGAQGWELLSLGCMSIMKGVFPRLYYTPPNYNYLGFTVSGDTLTSHLKAEFTQPIACSVCEGGITDRKITLVMPWMIVMDTVLVLEISLGVEATCDPPCETCSTCEEGECLPTTGDPCDDGLISTWPDYCNQGVCMGTMLTCRRSTEAIDWAFDCPPGVEGFIGDTQVQTYSAGYSISAQGIGLCLGQDEMEYVIRDCPAQSAYTFTRPAKVTFKMKAPCAMWEQGTLTAAKVEFKESILRSYGVLINGAGQIFVMLHGQEYIPVNSLKIDGTAFDDMFGDDSFHEIVIDMRSREVTYFYYNGRQIGESMTYIESGSIQIEGLWHTQVRVDDTSCPLSCDALYDCSGHGRTISIFSSADGCACRCDDNWTGDDCSQQEFIDLGGGSTCGGEPVESSSQGSFEDCVEFCDDNECTYFTFDEDTEECSLYEECIIEDAEEGMIPYQNRDVCYLDPAVVGSNEIKLLLSSAFVNDTLILYFQYPSAGMTLDELHFLAVTDDRGHYRRWGNQNPYWTAETVGCLTIMEGRFPFTDFYSPPFVNSLGLQVESNTLAGTLVSKCSQDMIFFERVVQRRIEYASVFVLVLQTTLELSIDVGVKDVCEGVSCGQCQECGGGGVCQPANEGQECDDFMQSTFPDTCVEGHCTGTDLCLTTECYDCQICIVVLNCDEDMPCAQCHNDPNQENAPCANNSRICVSGSCIEPPPADCPSFDHCDYLCDDDNCESQEGLSNPCCPFGNCPQQYSISPHCCGGHCDQTNSTDCSCEGGFCEQEGCTNPSCTGGGCTGNCESMMPQTCHICLDGIMLPNNNATCFLAGFENSHCVDGECVGDDIRCATSPPCPPCHSCVAEGADARCELDPDLEGTICMLPDVICQNGACIPPFQLVDSLVVNFGLQESDLSSLQAVISISGISSARWPWKLIEHENFTVLSTSEFPVASNEPFEITKDCTRPPSETNCHQNWAVSFTVDKICDTISRYDLLLFGDNWENDDIGSSIWTISVSQVSVCGMIIQDAPVEGTIQFMDDKYTRRSTLTSHPLDTMVYVQLDTKGLAPIVAVEVLLLSLTHLGQTYTLVGPGADTVLAGTLQVSPENVQGNLVRWTLWLDRDHFVASINTPVVQTVTVRVTYLEGRRELMRRFLVQQEEPAFAYSEDMLIRDKECGHPHSPFNPIAVHSIFLVDCDPTGRKTVYLTCTEDGWEDINKKCADPLVPTPQNDNSDSLMLILIIIIFMMLVMALFVYKYVSEDDDDWINQVCGGRSKKNKKKLRHGDNSMKKKLSMGGNEPLSRKNSSSRSDTNPNVRQNPRRVVKGRRTSSNRPGRRVSRRDSSRNSRSSRSGRRSRGESMRASRAKMSARSASFRQSTARGGSQYGSLYE